MRHNVIVFLMMFSVVIMSGIAHAQTPAPGTADVKAGQARFQQLCVTCHGATGRGDGPAAAALNPKPKDLTKTTLSDDQLKKIIREGGPALGLSPTMPPWGAMVKPAELDQLVQYIRSMKR